MDRRRRSERRSRPRVAPLILLVALAGAVAAQGAPAFVVEDRSGGPRAGVARVAMPFAPGARTTLDGLAVDGIGVEGTVALRWADGSVQLAHLHVPVRLAAGERRVVALAEDAAAPRVVPDRDAWPFPVRPRLRVEVEGPHGTVYACRLAPDPAAGPAGLVEGSRQLAVHRLRGTPRPVDGGPGAFLEVVAYLTRFRGARHAELRLVLDNQASVHRRHAPVGPVRLRRCSVVLDGADAEGRFLRLRPRYARELLLEPPLVVDGETTQHLLGPSMAEYLGDRTGRAFLLDLFLDGPDATDEDRRAAAAAVESPLFGVPDLDHVRRTRAWGPFGGPAPVERGRGDAAPAIVAGRAAAWLGTWERQADFGPRGGFGDPLDPAAGAGMRTAPMALHPVLRWQAPELLRAFGGMVQQHALRPTPGLPVRLPPETAVLRVGIGERGLQRPHGFVALGYEHFGVELLHEYWWLTGDPFARDELARLGEGLRPLLAGLPFLTSRGEGWCLQAGVRIARATRDGGLLDWLWRRFHRVVAPRMQGAPAGVVLAQPPHPEVFGEAESFDAPWQVAILVHGLVALHRATGDPRLVAAITRCADVMAGPGWVDGEGPKSLVAASDPGRYLLPVDHGIREGNAVMEIGAFLLAAERTRDVQRAALYHRRARFLLDPLLGDPTREPRDNAWLQVPLDREARR